MNYDEYLVEHGITQDTANRFGWVDAGGFKIAIPIKDANGNLLFHRYRHLTGEVKFTADSGSSAILYNSQVLNSESSFVIICEGEPDVVKLAQEGFPAISGTSGAGTFKEEWAEQIKASKKRVIVILDNDPAGIEGREKIKALLPDAWQVELPSDCKDICIFFKSHSKKDFESLILAAKSANTCDFDELCTVVDKWLKLPDKNVLKVITAGLVAHHFKSDPLWIFLVAPPAGTKTELITTISELSFVHLLSDLTPNTFLSGMIRNKEKSDPSLLMKLKNHVLVMKDFTTVLSMRHEERQTILAQLREIYDGKYSKAYGTGEVKEWEGRLSVIAGVTSMIDTHMTLFQVMGERFVIYRIPQPNDIEVAQVALRMAGHEKQMRQELKQALKRFFQSIVIPDINQIELPDNIMSALAHLASFIVIARSGVIRDAYHREVEYIPTPEAPSRLAKQLGTLIKALAVIERRRIVTWEDFMLTLRIALDVIPRNRSLHLIALASGYSLITSEIATKTGYSRSGSEIILEDLTALGLVSVHRSGTGSATTWDFSTKTKNYFNHILPSEASEWVERFFPETDLYRPLIEQMLKTETVELAEGIFNSSTD